MNINRLLRASMEYACEKSFPSEYKELQEALSLDSADPRLIQIIEDVKETIEDMKKIINTQLTLSIPSYLREFTISYRNFKKYELEVLLTKVKRSQSPKLCTMRVTVEI